MHYFKDSEGKIWTLLAYVFCAGILLGAAGYAFQASTEVRKLERRIKIRELQAKLALVDIEAIRALNHEEAMKELDARIAEYQKHVQ